MKTAKIIFIKNKIGELTLLISKLAIWLQFDIDQ